MKKTAILVIDVQKGMFNSKEWIPYKGEELLENINSLTMRGREEGVPVVYVQHTTEEGHFKIGTESWEIAEKIAPYSGEKIVQKTECDSFYKTELEETLKSMEIERVVICGMQTDFCVDTTCRSAYSKGYEIVIAKDCHTTFDNDVITGDKIVAHHNNIFKSFGQVSDHNNIQLV